MRRILSPPIEPKRSPDLDSSGRDRAIWRNFDERRPRLSPAPEERRFAICIGLAALTRLQPPPLVLNASPSCRRPPLIMDSRSYKDRSVGFYKGKSIAENQRDAPRGPPPADSASRARLLLRGWISSDGDGRHRPALGHEPWRGLRVFPEQGRNHRSARRRPTRRRSDPEFHRATDRGPDRRAAPTRSRLCERPDRSRRFAAAT